MAPSKTNKCTGICTTVRVMRVAFSRIPGAPQSDSPAIGATTDRRWKLSGAGRCLPKQTCGYNSEVTGMGTSRQKQTARDYWIVALLGQERQSEHFSDIIHEN